ncbi:peptidase S8/S53 domain-containing protein [Mycotypha africana]|uniref:peptidase S8/S53 domain-containing protein n=1 Tax=Mycotypha africana TaxID=64632 RepID=UPI0023014E80|nr:peptidase S8/S53 domain-containing protein [Mycotypha africana]KAI8968935.1 peptidase S8/S53 domain-containing protein [Mycotypha africana]
MYVNAATAHNHYDHYSHQHKHQRQQYDLRTSNYIVELAESPASALFLRENLQNQNIRRIRYTYDIDIFKGSAIEFKNDKVARQLINDHPQVLNAWPIRHHNQAAVSGSTDYKHHKNKNEEAGMIANETSVTPRFFPQHNGTIPTLTEAYMQYRNLRSNGSRVKIGIIDTGVDYKHPALGGCFGEGCKVAYGYDLVGNSFDGSVESIHESDDPIDDCPKNSTAATGHGTFIAGMIAAEDKEYNWTGIAPGATLGMWKVYGCNYASSPNDIILKAMEMAYKAGMDIISISLGVSGGWEEDILSVMADRLVSNGVHVVTAMGNSGTSGIFLAASPASAKNAIAVGSTMNDHVPGYLVEIMRPEGEETVPYRTFTNTALALNDALPFTATGGKFNEEKDACHSLFKNQTAKRHSRPPQQNNFNNSIVLIHQGGCSSLEKIRHAQEAGARAVLLYSDDKNVTTSIETLTDAVLPVAFINNDGAAIIYKRLSQRDDIKGRFTNTLVALSAPEKEVNAISAFSSLGPTYELRLKPELVGVGGNVFSTLPRYQNSYGFRSGTSMSTPFIAGNLALLLSNLNNDKINPALAKNILMNFASPVQRPIPASPYADSPIRQGAGIVNVAQTIRGYQQFHVSPAVLNLNDTAHFNNGRKITIYNHNLEDDLSLTIGHQPSLTATGYALKEHEQENYTPTEPVGLYAGNETSVANVRFSKEKIVIPAGQTATVYVRIEPPTKLFRPEDHVIYGGFITFQKIDHDSIKNDIKEKKTITAQIPYFGMIGNMRDIPILDRTANVSIEAPYKFPSIGLPNGNFTISNREDSGSFRIHYDKEIQAMAGGPYVLTRLLMGTEELQILVLDGEGKKVIGELPPNPSRSFMMRNTLGITEYSNTFYSWYWAGDYIPLNNKRKRKGQHVKVLKSGEYRLQVRALRVFGDRKHKKDWDQWISPKLILDINA